MIGLGLSLWRRGGSTGIDTTPTGTLLVDFTQQPITATGVTYGASGQQVTNDGALGNYTVTREVINHDSSLFGGSSVNTITLTADGWSMSNAGSNAPTAAKDFRPSITFSPPVDFTNVKSLTFEWGFPQKAVDFSQGQYVGLRPRIYRGVAYHQATNSMMTYQGTGKRRQMCTVVPFDSSSPSTITSTGWTTSGAPADNLVDKLQPRIDVIYNANGGTEVVLRRIWANRKQQKALVAFTFDDGSADHYTVAAPILQAAGGKGCEAVIADRIDVTPTYMTAAQIKGLHDTYGWALHNHMVTNDQTLEASLTYASYTAGSPNFVTFTVKAAVATAMVDPATTPTIQIRNSWGPEYAGTHNVLAVRATEIDVEVTGQTQLTISSQTQPSFRMDWPGVSRAARITDQVLPCNTAIAAAVGASDWRGKSVIVIPGGDFDPAVAADLQAAGFSGARGTGMYVSVIGAQTASAPLKTSTTTVAGTPYSLGWFDKWDMGVVDLGGVAFANIAQYTALIDEAVAKGYFIAFLIHSIQDSLTPTGGATSKQVLESLANTTGAYQASGQAKFVTLDEIVAAT